MKKLISKIILLDCAIALALFVALEAGLEKFGLCLRTAPRNVLIVLWVVGVFAGVLQLLLKIRKMGLKILLMSLFAILFVVFLMKTWPYAVFALADTEHVVERDGKKYVARVVGWLDTDVFYYDYINFLIQGNQEKIEEWYGNGAFDPLQNEGVCEPLRTRYYDEKGNLISEIEKD